jgi:hypothetical protein
MSITEDFVRHLSLFPESVESRIVACTGRLPEGVDPFSVDVRGVVSFCRKRLKDLEDRRSRKNKGS